MRRFQPQFLFVFGSQGDCKDEDGVKGRCVAGAIYNYTTQLLTYNTAASSQSQCITKTSPHWFSHLQSLTCSHFIVIRQLNRGTTLPVSFHGWYPSGMTTTYKSEKIHKQFLIWICLNDKKKMQPLHVGFASDKGGNTIEVHWYRRQANLHHVRKKKKKQSSHKTLI